MSLAIMDCGMDGEYLLSVPESIIGDMYRLRTEFLAWVADPVNGYVRTLDEGGERFTAAVYDAAELFPRWLNAHVLADSPEKAALLPRLDF